MADDSTSLELAFPALAEAMRNQYALIPPSGLPQAEWRINEFEDAIKRHGHNVLWQKASVCPCRFNQKTDQPDPLCNVCHGVGFEYYDPKIIKALIGPITQKIEPLENYGEWMSGECFATLLPDTPVSWRHRLTQIDTVFEYKQLVVLDRSNWQEDSTVLRLRYPVATFRYRTFNTSTAQVEPAQDDVNRVRLHRGETDENHLLLKNVHFTILVDGTLDFTPAEAVGLSPVRGDVLSVSYYTWPPWVVTDPMPYNIRGQRQEGTLPTEPVASGIRTVTMRLDYLLTPEDTAESVNS